ncbi:HTH CENPB-type domain-containing protein [Trichonephila clavipes]|nr:HTH CENPB-type domain-containing protein [Trichonephila clavipes]
MFHSFLLFTKPKRVCGRTLLFFLNSTLKDFIPNVKKLCECERKTGKVLFILDNAPCYPSVEVLNVLDEDFSVIHQMSLRWYNQWTKASLKSSRICRKQVLRRLLLAENDEESVPAFAEKLNKKNACYMLAEVWNSLERHNLKNAWNKLWPHLEHKKDFNDDHREIIDLVQTVLGFPECDEDVKTWTACDTEDWISNAK